MTGVAGSVPVGIAALLLAVGLCARSGSRAIRLALWALTAVDLAAMAVMWVPAAAPAAAGAAAGTLPALTMGAAMITMAWLLPRTQTRTASPWRSLAPARPR